MKTINEMTVKELITLPLFKEKINECIKELSVSLRKVAIEKHLALKRTPLDRLAEQGLLNGDSFTAIYGRILAKSEKKCSSNERIWIKGICDEALHRTVTRLKIEENANADK